MTTKGRIALAAAILVFLPLLAVQLNRIQTQRDLARISSASGIDFPPGTRIEESYISEGALDVPPSVQFILEVPDDRFGSDSELVEWKRLGVRRIHRILPFQGLDPFLYGEGAAYGRTRKIGQQDYDIRMMNSHQESQSLVWIVLDYAWDATP